MTFFYCIVHSVPSVHFFLCFSTYPLPAATSTSGENSFKMFRDLLSGTALKGVGKDSEKRKEKSRAEQRR